MGQSTVETVREIEQTRDRIEENLAELEQRLPQPAVWAKKAVGLAASGGVGATMLMFALKRRRRRKHAARAVAAEPVTAVVNLLPERWAEKLDDERTRAMLTGFGAAWLLLRTIELRQLRSLRRAVVTAR